MPASSADSPEAPPTRTGGGAERAPRPDLRILRSSTFRLALIYAALFGASALLLLGFIYWSTAGYMTRQTEAAIDAEIGTFSERYRTTGIPGLIALIEERLQSDSSVYLLADPAFRPLVGNLDGWPLNPGEADGWREFQFREGDIVQLALARSFTLRGNFHLLVGRDVRALTRTKHLITRTLAWGLGLTALLGLVGGALMSRSTARRIEAIHRTGLEIMRGDLSRRIPRDGSQDDFDRLAAHLNEMLDRMAASMDEVRQVTDNIAHDLRTPLGRLRNQLETLRARPGGNAAAEVDAAIEEADRLLSTFNALLRIARIESGTLRSGFGEVDMTMLLRDLAELYEPAAQERGQQIVVELPARARVPGDRDLLVQAFANLLDNAIKYSPEGGTVSLKLEQLSGGEARVRVSDTGTGIPQSERGAVMRRFYRGESSRTTAGSGLGLSLVDAVARLHRAELTLGGDGRGLVVEWRFPHSAASAKPRRSRA